MAKTDRAYPLTCDLELAVKDLVRTYPTRRSHAGVKRRKTVEDVLKVIPIIFGEYEHGTADVTDIHRKLTLRMVKEVYEDLILALGAYLLDETGVVHLEKGAGT